MNVFLFRPECPVSPVVAVVEPSFVTAVPSQAGVLSLSKTAAAVEEPPLPDTTASGQRPAGVHAQSVFFEVRNAKCDTKIDV